MSRYYVGVDGGGTGTRAILADDNERELARADGPASLADPARPEIAARVVAAVVREAADRAGVPLPVASVFAAVAGTGRETTRSGVELALQREGVADNVRVDTDVRAAFHDVFGEGAGILLLSGTGSMAWGRAEDGRVARVGGWGSVLGDEGSGYGIGREALRRVARGADGRGPQTGLGKAIFAHLGIRSADDLVNWAAGADKAAIAALVPLVGAQALEGDSVAAEILVHAVEELEGHVLTLVTTLSPWSQHPRIALTGGLLGPDGPLRKGIETVLARHSLRRTDYEPDAIRGAVRLARALDEEPV